MSTFIANTPEAQAARISRKDSLDFATTCCGVSPASGTPCRKGIPSNPGQKSSGIVTRYEGREYFFCSAHKDQAKAMALKHSKTFHEQRKRMGRTSIDTLVEKVEVVTGQILGDGGRPVQVVAQTTTATDQAVGTLGYTEFTTQGMGHQNGGHHYEKPTYKPPMKIDDDSGSKRGLLSLLCCCITIPLSIRKKHKKKNQLATIEEEPIARPTQVQFNNGTLPPPLPNMNPYPPRPGPSVLANGKKNTAQQMFSNAVSGDSVQKQSYKNRTPGVIYIPPTLSDETTAKLLKELHKPFSESDEPGYIYVFLLTDKPLSATPTATAGANPSRYLQRAAQHAPDAAPSKLMLKIGRAENVQRRMHQWQQQCSYNLQLMRYYPYVSSSTPPRQVPNCNRVERLIHIELADCNRIIDCSTCGKTHKEWFEIEATKEGLRSVDDTIKRWIKYAEDTAGKKGQAALKIPDMPHIKGSGGSRPGPVPQSSDTAFAPPPNHTNSSKKPSPTPASPPRKPAPTTTPSTPPKKKPTRPAASPGTTTLKPHASPNSRPNSRKPSPARPAKKNNSARRDDSDIEYDEEDSDGTYEWESGEEDTATGRKGQRRRVPRRAAKGGRNWMGTE